MIAVKAEYDEYLDQHLRRPQTTRRAVKFSIQRVERWASCPIQAVMFDAGILENFVRVAPYSPGTIMNTVANVKGLHKFGALRGYWPLNGVMGVQVPKYQPDIKPPLTPDESWAFLNACETPNEFRVTWLGHYVGTRESEASRMGPEMQLVDRWRFRGSKTGLIREVPIHPDLLAVIDRFIDVPNRGPRAMEYAVEQLKKRTGILTCSGTDEPITSQAFRRSFSTTLLDAEVPLWRVEALMGHRPSSMTLKAYASIPFRRKQGDMRKLKYGNGQMRLW